MSNHSHPIARLRALALGPGIVEFCEKTSPRLQEQTTKLLSATERLHHELTLELDDLQSGLHEGTRAAALQTCVVLVERLASVLDKTTTIQHKLTGGGAAAVWVGMARLSNPPAPDDSNERNVTPRRLLSAGTSQVVDIEDVI